jgi:hypothetical protein
MFIPDPGFTHPGSKNSNKREGWKKICCIQKFHKIENYFIFELLENKVWANFQSIIELLIQKFVTKLSKNMSLGSGIREKPIPDPRPGFKKAPDPDPQHWLWGLTWRACARQSTWWRAPWRWQNRFPSAEPRTSTSENY